jgi:hypothetical protein
MSKTVRYVQGMATVSTVDIMMATTSPLQSLDDQPGIHFAELEMQAYNDAGFTCQMESETTMKRMSIKINPQILDFTPIDLVIGRNTIRQHSIFSEVPSQLSLLLPSSTTDSVLESDSKIEVVMSCGCQPDRTQILDGAPKSPSSAQKQDLAVAQTHGILASMTDKTDHLVRISAADVDEIDESASDSSTSAADILTR